VQGVDACHDDANDDHDDDNDDHIDACKDQENNK